MRVVIDNNQISGPQLEAFLRASPSNRAVVTDWLWMEAYKSGSLEGVYKSVSVLAKFPRQVVVVKNSSMCMCTRVGSQMANRLIWREIQQTFPTFITEVQAAQAGDSLMQGYVRSLCERARDRMSEMLEDAPNILERQKIIFDNMKSSDIETIRGRRDAEPEVLIRLTQMAIEIADAHRSGLRDAVRPKAKDMLNDFGFRLGVALVCWFVEWVRTGSPKGLKPEKLRNDYVDAMISIYGTYFNGVMTGDGKLRKHHVVNRHLLSLIGARLPPAYGFESNEA